MIMYYGETDIGRRRTLNEDAILTDDDLFIVCDGMGGHKAGEVASKIATDVIATFIRRSREDPEITCPTGLSGRSRSTAIGCAPRSNWPTAPYSAKRRLPTTTRAWGRRSPSFRF